MAKPFGHGNSSTAVSRDPSSRRDDGRTRFGLNVAPVVQSGLWWLGRNLGDKRNHTTVRILAERSDLLDNPLVESEGGVTGMWGLWAVGFCG